jgi:drug/metabolite transporter superfamily protein YnfA
MMTDVTNRFSWVIFVAAAALEVTGDAVVRRGLRGGGVLSILAGTLLLGGYGLLVNSVPWDFSRLLGVYVGFMALMSILCGRFVFRETVPASTWIGLALILAGGLIIQFGRR